MDLVEEIKSRLSIYDVVSQYVQLKKAGRSYKGLCPFHNEKTPSFIVSPEKDICHCFGCGKGGDIFKFMQDLDGLSFPETLQILADRANIELKKSDYPKEKGSFASDKDDYFMAHELASAYFQEELFNSPDGKKVLEYLYKRGVNDNTISEFKLGFSPNAYDSLYPYLLKKGLSKKLLYKCGFVSSKSLSLDSVYDKFRGRLMFPIFNHFGKICAFTGRALSDDQMPKYLNSPETAIYSKSRILFGYYQSKNFIKEKDKVILVEGQFDFLLPYQEGVKNLVATSGTALTQDQVKILSRVTKNFVTCFDSDNAGFEATLRSFLILKSNDLQVETVYGLKGKDPADYVLNDLKGFVDRVNGAKDFLDFYLDSLVGKNDVGTLKGRNEIFKQFLPYLKTANSVEQDHYLRRLANILGIEESVIYDEINNISLPDGHPAKIIPKEFSSNTVLKISLEENLIALFLFNKKLFAVLSEKLSENDFISDLKLIYNDLANQYNAGQDDAVWDFNSAILSQFKEKIDIYMLFAESNYGTFSEEKMILETKNCFESLKRMEKDREKKSLKKQIEEAENSGDKEKLMILLSQHQKIISEK